MIAAEGAELAMIEWRGAPGRPTVVLVHGHQGPQVVASGAMDVHRPGPEDLGWEVDKKVLRSRHAQGELTVIHCSSQRS
ncbi:hypothetical protein [Streptomyces sp. NPDC002133]|uniref:hypothetical protein n=1 Tax=Streptomyces sp. NPDC002133 TaxID=3154409 RepID=UPI00331D1F0D